MHGNPIAKNPSLAGQVTQLEPVRQKADFIFTMRLKKKTIEKLKGILKKDYNLSVNDNKAQEYGISLLKITRLALAGQARKNALQSPISGKKEISTP